MNPGTRTIEALFEQIETLSSLDKVRLAERLFALLKRDVETLSQPETDEARLHRWRDTVDRTAGALADDPIERPPQGEYEQRDAIL